MMRHEAVRLFRNEKWKYLLPILLLCVLYSFLMGSDVDNVYQSSILPVFSISFLLYHIAEEEEHSSSWMTLFAFPIQQGKRLFMKIVLLILLQFPIAFCGMSFYFVLTKEISIIMLHYTVCIQLIYLTGFLISSFVVSSGYMSLGGSITILNVMKTMTPVFLLSCILNGPTWIAVFHEIWIFLLFLFLFIISIFLLLHDHFMRRKLYRETILFKVFGSIASNQMSLMMDNYRQMLDTLSQKFMKLICGKSKGRWRLLAVLEITLKLNGFYLLSGILCFIVWYYSEWVIFLLVGCVCFAYVIIMIQKERKKFHNVYIA